MRVIVIMAGGSGERFWPLSRRSKPKQLLALTGEKSMLACTVERAEAVVGAGNVYIVAGASLMPRIAEVLPAMPRENLIAEPKGRNTAPCLALAAAVIARRHGEACAMGVLTADHLIRDIEAFSQNADLAFECAERHGSLMTIGIRPTHANTGFGYLEIGATLETDARGEARRVASFREKPDAETARHYVESGHFLWNSGMFFWRIDALLDAFERHAPEFAEGARRLGQAPAEGEAFQSVVDEVFEAWSSISIDYAVMEKAENVAAVVSRFDWDDVGTWSALARIHPLDATRNLLKGKCVALDTKNCILYSKSAPNATEPLVATLGVENLIVVVSESAVLVCHRDREQDIKKLIERLRADGSTEYL